VNRYVSTADEEEQSEEDEDAEEEEEDEEDDEADAKGELLSLFWTRHQYILPSLPSTMSYPSVTWSLPRAYQPAYDTE